MSGSEGLRPASSGRKPLGKLALRLEQVKSPWRQVSSLELSHNEAARLATDALLEHGEHEYRRVLAEERELSFLSPLELRYITEQQAARAEGAQRGPEGPDDRDLLDLDAASDLNSGTYFPMMSDDEPPMLELGWPDGPARFGPSETQIYFQRDKSHNVKDLIRSLINRAKKVIAVVMDVFTDVDLLCDLMEASNKRRVPVYVLLDRQNLDHFTGMCAALDLQGAHMSNMRVRSTCGDTYCTKSGKKFSGQILEKFMIIDCEEVIAGSYSFTWLSAQVHSNMMMHFSGRIADSFDREFRCLYADSLPVDGLLSPEDEGGGAYYEGGGAYYQPYQAAAGPAPLTSADLLADRQRDRVSSEHSSSQSSNSVSSVKAAPTVTSNPVYKVTQGHDSQQHSPERRGGGATPQGLSANGGLHHGPAAERTPPGGAEWNKPADATRFNVGGASSKFQALGLYDHKAGLFHGAAGEPKPPYRPRSGSNQFLTKLSDLFLPAAGKDAYGFRRSPPPPGAAPWPGPDLSRAEPESQQSPPPPPPLSPTGLMSRQDQKRMTLGHSKLDLVNQYNQMKSRQVYSRFELKTSD